MAKGARMQDLFAVLSYVFSLILPSLLHQRQRVCMCTDYTGNAILQRIGLASLCRLR